jgi:hypothetical protein
MDQERRTDTADLSCSVYYARSIVRCDPLSAWEILLSYEAWNPSFATAQTSRIHGTARCEGEIVRIVACPPGGDPQPAFYAETVKLVPQQHIVWHVYPEEGDSFRNFLEFGLSPRPEGVQFDIRCYARERMSADALAKHRSDTETGLQGLALAFKEYCERRA